MKKFLFLLVVLAGCQSNSEYWQMSLPAHFNSSHPEKFTEILPDSVRDKNFTQALLFEEGGITTYMTIPLPVHDYSIFIKTVDENGNNVDDLLLFNGFNESQDVSDVTILPDRTILKIDTIYAIVVDSNGNVDDTMREMSVTTRKFRITDSGKIETLEEHGL